MSGKPDQWTRRQFTQIAALSSLLGWKALAAAPSGTPGLAFVVSCPANADSGAIHVFRVSGSHWTATQTLAAAAPAHLVAHPTLPVLYAVHHVGLWTHLPRGAISAYAIAPVTGRLTHIHTQPLSLSATYPGHAAVSPDGRYLFATAEGGGLYNLLPIGPDGALEPPSAIRKELGLSEGPIAKAAAPRQAIFHPDGETILTADSGQETISAFSFDRDSIRLRRLVRTHPGAGPAQIALSHTGDWLYALNATDGSVAMQRMGTDRTLQLVSAGTAQHPGPAMAIHASGRFLVTAGRPGVLTCFSIDADSGQLSERSVVPLAAPLSLLLCPSDGTHLFGIAHASGRIFRLALDAAAGTLGEPEPVAQVDAASSLLVHPVRL